MKTVIVVLRFDTPITRAQRDGRSDRMAPCIEAHGLKKVWTWVSEDGLHQWCQFEAPSVEAVRQACRSADIPILSAHAVWQEFP